MTWWAKVRPDRVESIDAGFVLAVIGLALWGFESSYGGIEFWVVGMLMALIGAVTVHLLDRFAVSLVLRCAIWPAVYLVGAATLASPTVVGVLPSPQGFADALRVPIDGWKQLLTTVPPVGGSSQLLVLPAFAGFVGCALSVHLARRRSWLMVPAIPAVLVLALGILCGTLVPVSVVLHGAVFTFVVLVWASIRNARRRSRTGSHAGGVRRIGAMALFVGLACLVGLLAGSSLPFAQARERVVWRDTVDPPFDPNDYASPLGYYRQYVKELEETPLFEVAGLPPGTPIRMATFDEYDGVVWRVSGGARALPGSAGYFQRVGTDVSPDHPGEMTDVTVTVPVDSGYSEVWLPTVGEVESVEFSGGRAREVSDAYRYNITTDTAAMLTDLSAGDGYTMTVALPTSIDDVPDDATFGEAPLDPIDGVDGAITGLGSGLVEDVEGIDRVRILADYFSREGYYSDSKEDDGQALVPPGHGVGRLKSFADSSELVGNAEQYAATLGLILRNSGIPARVVMGFVPEVDETGSATVTGNDAEAWVEVLVDGVGWVAAFPTPDRSKTSIEVDDSPRPIPDRETQVPPPPPVVEADADAEPAGESRQRQRDPDEEREDDEEDGAGGGVSWLILAGVAVVSVPLVVIGVVVGAILLVKRRRRAQRRTSGRPDERIANGWRELVDCAVDAGRDVPGGLTRREVARSLDVGGAGHLAVRADEAVFGATDPSLADGDAYWDDLERAWSDVRSELKPFDRWRADLSLESIRRARAERRLTRRRR